MTSVVVQPAFTEAPYRSQIEELAFALREINFDAVIESVPEERTLYLPVPHWDIVVRLLSDAEDHVLDLIAGAIVAKVSGLAKIGPRKGQRRRVVIVDPRGNPLREVLIPEDASGTEEHPGS